MRERNTARNEGVLRTINGFESIAHLAHFLPPHLHYGRYDLCNNHVCANGARPVPIG